MVEPVTRQFADRITGAPITGGDYQLRDILGIDPSVAMTEATDPLYPGRYTANESLRPGIWAVQRKTTGDYEDTGEHITVGPGWTFAGAIDQETGVVPVELTLGSVVHATAFVPLETGGAPTAAPTIAHLQAAVNYAAEAGIKRVYVGSYKGINDWTGASALDLTAAALAGVILDLGGARLKRTTSGGPVISMRWGFICNGAIEGTGNNAVAEIVGSNDGWTPICCYHVNFPRDAVASDTSATVQMATGGNCPARFIQCVGQRLFKQAFSVGETTRMQTSDTQCEEVSAAGGLESFIPPEQGNVQGELISMFFAEAMTSGDVSLLPSETAPFSTAQRMARALKHLWFTQNPVLDYLRSHAPVEERIAVKRTMAAKFNTYVWTGDYADAQAMLPDESLAVASTGSDTDLAEGFIVTKTKPYNETKYRNISLEVYAKWHSTSLNTGMPGYSLWRPREIFFTIPDELQAALFDVNGTDSVLPGVVVWGRPVDGSGFFFQQNGTGNPQRGMCRLSGFSVSVTDSVMRISVSPAHTNSPANPSEWLRSAGYNSPGDVIMKLHLSWSNPNDTSIPGVL